MGCIHNKYQVRWNEKRIRSFLQTTTLHYKGNGNPSLTTMKDTDNENPISLYHLPNDYNYKDNEEAISTCHCPSLTTTIHFMWPIVSHWTLMYVGLNSTTYVNVNPVRLLVMFCVSKKSLTHITYMCCSFLWRKERNRYGRRMDCRKRCFVVDSWIFSQTFPMSSGLYYYWLYVRGPRKKTRSSTNRIAVQSSTYSVPGTQ